jgi:hypothetical protein
VRKDTWISVTVSDNLEYESENYEMYAEYEEAEPVMALKGVISMDSNNRVSLKTSSLAAFTSE